MIALADLEMSDAHSSDSESKGADILTGAADATTPTPQTRRASTERLSATEETSDIRWNPELIDDIAEAAHYGEDAPLFSQQSDMEEQLRLHSTLRRNFLHPSFLNHAGVHPFFSSIVRAPFFHLQKWTRAKDAIVPSGPQATFTSSVFNMVNSIIGAGVLSLSVTMSWAGLVVMVITIPILGLLMFGTCDMMIEAGKAVDGVTYNFLATKSFGRFGGLVIDMLTALSGFFSLVAYLVLIGNFGTELFRLVFGYAPNNVYVVITLGTVLCLPLSLLPSVNSLRFASIIAIVSVVFFACVVLYMYGVAESTPEPTLFNFDGFFRAFPVALFAFSCQMNLFPIIAEMRSDVRPKARWVVATGFLVCGVIYFLVALFGYLLFGDDVEDNLIQSIATVSGSPIVPVLIAYTFVIVTSYPVVNFSTRLSVINIAWRDHKTVHMREWIVTVITFILAVVLAVSGISLGFILALTGSLTTAPLSMIFPAVFYIKLKPEQGCVVQGRGQVAVALCRIVGHGARHRRSRRCIHVAGSRFDGHDNT
jgi:amino acid permease